MTVMLVGCFISNLHAQHRDIEYLPAQDQGIQAFNHAATAIFLNGDQLLDGIGIGSSELGSASTVQLRSPLKQLLATFYTFAGRYDKARNLYIHASHPNAVTDALARNQAPRFVRASDAVAALAEHRKALFLNENHGEPITRVLVLELLPKLKKEGYNYLALETLTRATHFQPPPRAGQCLALKDTKLCSRGYALDSVETGIYSHDPLYGELIRTALSLGFHLVAYDDDHAPDDVARDQSQAANLALVLHLDPEARLVVLGGFDHIAKEDTNMAADFRSLTGIDPLSVDQVDLLGVDPRRWGKYEADARRYDASVVFLGGRPLSTRPSAMDITIFRPAYSATRSAATWLGLDGRRRRVSVVNICESYPCLLSARRSHEPDGVPADRLYLDSPHDPIMYLSPGRYRLTVETMKKKEMFWLTVSASSPVTAR